MAIKCAWVKRLTSPNDANWKDLVNYFLPEFRLLIWTANLNAIDIKYFIKHESQFWSDILKAWTSYNFHNPSNSQEILCVQIWFNSFIKVVM